MAGLATSTVVYPLARGSGPLMSSPFAILVLGEDISALGVAGALATAMEVRSVGGHHQPGFLCVGALRDAVRTHEPRGAYP